ncbi:MULTISPECIES: tetrahydromethanopterin S-methyltransferase subunit F [Methanothermobacter]|uniref:Tetrahydromethanopterin S-methyltransferase subunit F n=1 Tax=Methanothermobacter marburgensis (strain ATCC BAA-927 / DSM 2133 / JCM 14651 / NBRC 100331 / OCM 82 / Marburg) TaxID=79929 RepID=MTRF_METTM|nr:MULTISPECIES: tetrahydromethanopterin S-methyltransferase subunit F [Methanothermobacter]Q50773.1 RecName: Full=Tetrahydromethanopterin S-methyltransferase subunit F; AltName: Full=N5-methyltetrahydromethanopterin--coenzyme M methyltransferase subunit F [Methanothermobacter marburgensis str. Marburg]pir/S68975/ tetrahydromethanopterin S-methyltransferase (EC 2.1.1.86) chain F mtrF [validated] - Methanobacterium thermoautotrophicum (strain Marburg) [Methanothermobacter thermautotrophicus]ADL59
MIILSNKPNIRGIKNVVEDIKYRNQLIGRDGRLFAGLIATRISGIAIGFLLAVLLVGVPAMMSILGVI